MDYTVALLQKPGGLVDIAQIPNGYGVDTLLATNGPTNPTTQYAALLAEDSPGEEVKVNESFFRVFVATTWLEAEPANGPGFWVPLEKITWGFVSYSSWGGVGYSGFAWAYGAFQGGNKHPNSIFCTGGSYDQYAFSNTTDFPQWTRIAPIGNQLQILGTVSWPFSWP